MSGMSSYGAILYVVLILAFVVWRRTRAMRRPIRGNGIWMLIPILILLLLGSQLFIGKNGANFQASDLEITGALVLGVLFSIPMILTTHYEIREDGQIYTKKSTGFIIALVGLIIVRLLLRTYITDIPQMTLAMLFYVVAMTYLTIWRVVSFIRFRKVWREKQGRVDNV